MLNWLAKFDNKHTRFLFGLSIAVFSCLELAYLAWGFKNVELTPSYRAACIYLTTLAATTVLCVTPIAFLNYILKQWVKYQVLCECLWVGTTIVSHGAGTIVAIVHQVQMNCGGLFANPDVRCQNNSLFIILGLIIVVLASFLLGNVILIIRYLRCLSSKSVWTILFTATRRLAMVPVKEPRSRAYRYPARSTSFQSADSMETGQSLDVFGKSASEMITKTKFLTPQTSPQSASPQSPTSDQTPLTVQLEVNFSKADPSQKLVKPLSPLRMIPELPRPPPRILAQRYYERRHAKAWI